MNEGFAIWMETKPIEAWHPEWHLEDDEAVTAQRIIGIDSLDATRAIHGDPKTLAEIKTCARESGNLSEWCGDVLLEHAAGLL